MPNQIKYNVQNVWVIIKLKVTIVKKTLSSNNFQNFWTTLYTVQCCIIKLDYCIRHYKNKGKQWHKQMISEIERFRDFRYTCTVISDVWNLRLLKRGPNRPERIRRRLHPPCRAPRHRTMRARNERARDPHRTVRTPGSRPLHPPRWPASIRKQRKKALHLLIKL